MDTFINDFLEFLSVEKGASGNTIAAYRNDLGQLEEFLAAKKNGSGIKWQIIGQDEVLEYILYLKSNSYAEATVARKVAARAGVHVLCDKPMAVMADECRRMIRTSQSNRVKLMVSYRLGFHPAHARAIELVRSGAIGMPKTISSDYTIRIDDADVREIAAVDILDPGHT